MHDRRQGRLQTSFQAPPGNPLILRLARSGVLTEADEADLEALTASARTVPAETDLVREGELRAELHIVTEGFGYRYKVLRGGERQILGLLLPGDFCDLHGAVLGRADHAIAALTDCSVAGVPHARVDALTFARTRIARALWWATHVDTSILREWLTNNGRRPADRRMAHLFCEIRARLDVVGLVEGDACAFPVTQDKLGDVLGITGIHVNRVLKELRDRNLAVLSRRRLRIPDIGRLQAYCDFEPDYLHLTPDAPPGTGEPAP